MRLISLLLICMFLSLPYYACARSPAPEMGPADLYFLAVGAGNAQAPDKPKLKAARDSAEVVARSLIRAGARYGILLTSDEKSANYVTRQDVYAALTKLKRKIRQDGSNAPRVVVYLMMHGAADAASNYIFMYPDNLYVRENPVDQEFVFRLAKRTIWNNDLLTALMNFRLDERFNHFDDFVYSSLYSDKLGFQGVMEQASNIYNYGRDLDERKRNYGPAPFKNAPIPFVLLMDNCTDGFRYNLVEPNPMLDNLKGATNEATLDGGRAFYAVRPGRTATILELPDYLTSLEDEVNTDQGSQSSLVSPYVGPLAVHIKNVLKSKDQTSPMTLAEFARQFAESSPRTANDTILAAPYVAQAHLRPDVAAVDFFPAKSDREGTITVIPPTGTSISTCCAVVD